MRPLPVGAIVLLAACSSQSPASASIVVLDRDFDLKAGETARLEDSDLVMRFEAVTSDSRCPADVTCITAGDALVRLHVRGGGAGGRAPARPTPPGPGGGSPWRPATTWPPCVSAGPRAPRTGSDRDVLIGTPREAAPARARTVFVRAATCRLRWRRGTSPVSRSWGRMRSFPEARHALGRPRAEPQCRGRRGLPVGETRGA